MNPHDALTVSCAARAAYPALCSLLPRLPPASLVPSVGFKGGVADHAIQQVAWKEVFTHPLFAVDEPGKWEPPVVTVVSDLPPAAAREPSSSSESVPVSLGAEVLGRLCLIAAARQKAVYRDSDALHTLWRAAVEAMKVYDCALAGELEGEESVSMDAVAATSPQGRVAAAGLQCYSLFGVARHSVACTSIGGQLQPPSPLPGANKVLQYYKTVMVSGELLTGPRLCGH